MDTPRKDSSLFDKARKDLAADMASRGMGAILWDNSQTGFHYLPVVAAEGKSTEGDDAIVIDGMYLFDGKVYLIEEGVCPVSVDDLYNPDTEVKPVVVTLPEKMAARILGDADTGKGFTQEGTLEQWLAIADCYYAALDLSDRY